MDAKCCFVDGTLLPYDLSLQYSVYMCLICTECVANLDHRAMCMQLQLKCNA